MRASLADRADLRRLRPLAAAGPGAAIAACLIDAEVVQLDRTDPSWPDRDRIVGVVSDLVDAVAARMVAAGVPADIDGTDSAGEALGVALGAALLSARQGVAWRVWCLLDTSADDDGVVWEAARATAVSWPLPLVVVLDGAPGALWEAAGWTVHHVAGGGDVVHLLAALDRAIAGGERPSIVAVGP